MVKKSNNLKVCSHVLYFVLQCQLLFTSYKFNYDVIYVARDNNMHFNKHVLRCRYFFIYKMFTFRSPDRGAPSEQLLFCKKQYFLLAKIYNHTPTIVV